jgi:hypothetical protein
MNPTSGRSGRPLALLVVALLAACTASPPPSASTGLVPSASPSGAPRSAPALSPSDRPATTPGPPALPLGRDAGWQRVPDQASVSAAQFQDVVWTGRRFVATAVVVDGGGAFLDSLDGREWHLQRTMSDGAPARLAAGPGGVVAVGRIGERLASWSSVDDGRTWTSRAGAFPVPAAGSDTFAVADVVATDTGWLTVGREDPACQLECYTAPLRALAWTSMDGLHWTRVADQGAFDRAGMNAVVRVEGGFAAAGTADGHAAFWTSPTGATWSRGSDGGSWAPISGLAARFGTVVAVGMAQDANTGAPSVLAWRSADGRAWEPAPVDQSLDGQVFDVAATPAGFLATGPSGGGRCVGGIWASTDGAAWTCDASDPAFQGFGPYASAGSDSVEVAVGLWSDDESGSGLPGGAWWRAIR